MKHEVTITVYRPFEKTDGREEMVSQINYKRISDAYVRFSAIRNRIKIWDTVNPKPNTWNEFKNVWDAFDLFWYIPADLDLMPENEGVRL